MSARVALVTGAARGLGQGIAGRLVDDGWHVVLVDLAPEVVDTAQALSPDGTAAWGVVADVTDPVSCAATAGIALERFGALHALVNNAGISGPSTPAHETDPDEFRRVLEVNLVAPLLMARATVAHIVDSGGGAIVNITSVLGQRAEAGSGAYSASKAGLALLGQSMALELAGLGIRVNSVAPGNMLTEMHGDHVRGIADRDGSSYEEALDGVRSAIPLGRHGTAQDIGDVVAWLLSDRASYVTGQSVAVNGGILLT